MSLLDEAKQLPYRRIHEYRGDGLYSCVMCGWAATRAELDQPDMALVHTGDCPWLAMPRIVAALVAAETLADPIFFADHDLAEERPDAHVLVCSSCGVEASCDCTEEECDDVQSWGIAMRRNFARIRHEDECPQAALVAALKGD